MAPNNTHHLDLLVARGHDRLVRVGRVLVDATVVQPIVLVELRLGAVALAAGGARVWRVTGVQSV